MTGIGNADNQGDYNTCSSLHFMELSEKLISFISSLLRLMKYRYDLIDQTVLEKIFENCGETDGWEMPLL